MLPRPAGVRVSGDTSLAGDRSSIALCSSLLCSSSVDGEDLLECFQDLLECFRRVRRQVGSSRDIAQTSLEGDQQPELPEQ